jgi:hypothetical protein
MKKRSSATPQSSGEKVSTTPQLKISKLGIVSRNYQRRFSNRYRDFSHAMPDILKLLDSEGCDAVMFSLFTIVPRQTYDPRDSFGGLENINAVFLEEFKDGEKRTAGRYVVYFRGNDCWQPYDFKQQFGTTYGMKENKMHDFVTDEIPKRILGNCCVLICGESNGVRYSQDEKKIHDIYGLRRSIPRQASIILNPIHDYMIRFEMKLKRKFLSQNRWVISVWNKGKKDQTGRNRDAAGPAWTVYFDGKEIKIEPIANALGVDLGTVDFGIA